MLRLPRACRSATRLLTNLGKVPGHVSNSSWFATSAPLGSRPQTKPRRPKTKTGNLLHSSTAKSLTSQNDDASSLRDDDEELDNAFDDEEEELDSSWDDDPDLTIAVERAQKRPRSKDSRRTKTRPRPPSILEHIIMRLCRDVPPGGRMQQSTLRRVRKHLDRTRKPLQDTVFLSLFQGAELARRESILRGTLLDQRSIVKMIANMAEYTRKIQKGRASMLEDLACRNIAFTLKRTEELRILKPNLEDALLNLLISRKKQLKFDTQDFGVVLDLMRWTSRARDEYQQALMRLQEPHVGSTGEESGLGHPDEKLLLDANALLRRSVGWLVEAGIVRMELKTRLFDVFWEQVEIITTRAKNRRWSLGMRAAPPEHKREKKESEGQS